jgi:hypothetical protein
MIGHRQFDHATHIRHLEQAERHVAQGERHIAEQEERVAHLARRGHNVSRSPGNGHLRVLAGGPNQALEHLLLHSLEEVLQPGYFADAVESSVRPFDRIEVTAGVNGEQEFAMLVVRSVVNPRGGGKSVEVERLG